MNGLASFDQSHTSFNTVLSKYTKVEGFQTLVNYKSLKKDQNDLKNYLKQIEDLSSKEFKTFSSDQKLAFWINAYNAYTLKLIISHYPVKSIKDIGSFFSGPWSKKIAKIFGEKLSLDKIEHGIIRKRFNEPRIHFAVNCASIGCPSLLTEAFTGDKLELQLEKASKNFLNNKSKNYHENGTLYISKIFDWYGDDFKKRYGSHKKYIKKHYGLNKKVSVEFLNYDWKLNEF
jgi:hypothetical protein